MDERNLAVLNVKYMSMERSRRHDLRTAVCKLQQCERGQRHCPSVVSLSLHAVTCPECQRKDYVWEHCEPVQCITLSQCITHCRSVSHIVSVYHTLSQCITLLQCITHCRSVSHIVAVCHTLLLCITLSP